MCIASSSEYGGEPGKGAGGLGPYSCTIPCTTTATYNKQHGTGERGALIDECGSSMGAWMLSHATGVGRLAADSCMFECDRPAARGRS
jgi:hypothetical protein